MQILRPAPTFWELLPHILRYLVAPYALAALIIAGRGKLEGILLLTGLLVAGLGTWGFVSALSKRLPLKIMPDGTVTNGFRSAQLSDCRCVLIRWEGASWYYTVLDFPDCEFAVDIHQNLREDVRRAADLAVRFHVPAFQQHFGGKRQRIRPRPPRSG